MTRPTARVLALLELLQRGGTRPVAELAERLGVVGEPEEAELRRLAGPGAERRVEAADLLVGIAEIGRAHV